MLSNPEKRANYDRWGKEGVGTGGGAGFGSNVHSFADAQELFNAFFGGADPFERCEFVRCASGSSHIVALFSLSVSSAEATCLVPTRSAAFLGELGHRVRCREILFETDGFSPALPCRLAEA